MPEGFNYIVGLHLLIVGFGINKIVDGLGALIERRGGCKPYWAHTLGALLVGMLLLQNAWNSFQNYTVPVWSFPTFLLICSTPLIYLFVSTLLFPSEYPDKHDLRKTYRLHIKQIGFLAIAAQFTSSATVWRLHPGPDVIGQDIIRVIACALLGCFFFPFPRFRRLHEVVMCLLVVALAVFLALYTPLIPQAHN